MEVEPAPLRPINHTSQKHVEAEAIADFLWLNRLASQAWRLKVRT